MLTKNNRGFTIVELLVVIVVIGILAAITIVAFNGIRERAANAAVIAGAQQAQKTLDLYTQQEGSYPTTTSNYCLTVDNRCKATDGSDITLSNASLITTLAKSGNLPSSVPNPAGLRYSYQSGRTLDGAPMPGAIVYKLTGVNTNCGVRTVASSGGTVNYIYTTTSYSSSSSTETICIIPLKDASNL